MLRKLRQSLFGTPEPTAEWAPIELPSPVEIDGVRHFFVDQRRLPDGTVEYRPRERTDDEVWMHAIR